MKVIAIGDTHLRVRDRRHGTRMRALTQILEAARAQDVDLIVWPGDLFDRESEIEDRNALRAYVRSLAEVAPVVAVRGNHDVSGDGDFLADQRTVHDTWFVTRPQVLVVPTKRGDVAVAALPYPELSGLVAAGVSAAQMSEAVRTAFDVLFSTIGHELDAHVSRGTPTIFAGHVTVGGSVLSTGQVLAGHDLQIDATHLAKLPSATPAVLNHIHKPQTLHGAHYVGSVCACNYGETEQKRFLVLEHTAGGWRVESVPLNVAPLFHVEGVFDGTTVSWVVKRGPDGAVEATPASFRGCEVRARVRFSAGDAGRLAVAKAQLVADFAEAAHLEIEPVAIPEQSVRAPEIARATTTPEKLDQWCRLAGVSTSDGVLAKLAQLEAPDRDAILVELEARLRGSAVAA